MNTKNIINKYLTGNLGLGLVQVMFVAGILGGMVLLVPKISEKMNADQVRSSNNSTLNNIKQLIKGSMGNGGCSYTFNTAAPSVLINTPITSIKNKSNHDILDIDPATPASTCFDNDAICITGLSTQTRVPPAPPYVAGQENIVDLVLTYTQKRVGSSTVSGTNKIGLRLVTDASDKITECRGVEGELTREEICNVIFGGKLIENPIGSGIYNCLEIDGYSVSPMALAKNTVIGADALLINVNGVGNVALGQDALQSNSNGSVNVALGLLALQNNKNSNQNTALGTGSLNKNKTGINNLAIGLASMAQNQNGKSNVAIGAYSSNFQSNHDETTAIGYAALQNSIEKENTAVGTVALANLTTGTSNTAAGFSAGGNTTLSSFNTYFGYFSGNNTINNKANLAIGQASGQQLGANSNANTFIGSNAGRSLQTSSDSNVAIGADALIGNSNPNNLNSNIALGAGVLPIIKSGAYQNIYIGAFTGQAMETGHNNITVGVVSGYFNVATHNNISLGTHSHGDVGDGIAIGNCSVPSGPYQFVVRHMNNDSSLPVCTSGSEMLYGKFTQSTPGNALSGTSEGLGLGGGYTAGNMLTVYGPNPSHIKGGVNVVKATILGAGLSVIGASKITGNLNVTGNITATGTISPSDRRLKKNVQSLTSIRESFLNLNPVTYQLKDDPSELIRYGLIAQEVIPLFPSLVHSNSENFFTLSYIEMVPLLTKFFQEQDQIIQKNKEVFKTFSVGVSQLENEFNERKKDFEEIKTEMKKLKNLVMNQKTER